MAVDTQDRNGGGAPEGNRAATVSASQAFSLGWNVCILYTSEERPSWTSRKTPPDRLPSPSRFSGGERSVIRLGQVKRAIDHFSTHFASTGDDGLSDAAKTIDELIPQGPGWATDDDPRLSLCTAHLALARALSANDARLAKAYHLGVALATTCYAPHDLHSLQQEFNRYRVAQLGEWLADLTSLLPDHSSRAVRLSCATWRRWAEDPQVSVAEASGGPGDSRGAVERVTARATRATRPLDWETDGQDVRRSLARQGEMWRALLSGEKPGTAMLELHDYLQTGIRALKNGIRLMGGVWIPLLVALALLAFGSWLLVKDEGAGATVAGLVTVAGSIGITWKGILGGVGTVASKLQQPVWGAALDEEIASAVTELPTGARPESERAGEAAPASGPQASILALPEEVAQTPEWAA